ncbi:hypothetical protein O9G_002533 [Rozella allomycis CSF55]|uniref:Cyclin N-terminal domain-containing protein n=1 Tax=Rozella allomycis (strain CSF55) TaxID=988480 RepID=A0A075AU42_ROZAC|nr:hypothetical protein O9G_002533 [Rozella allomycis CSF55]|eukprot:EPZ33821.1 hypothetical protein O9G_002533 [Rozella allomycis CSF55]
MSTLSWFSQLPHTAPLNNLLIEWLNQRVLNLIPVKKSCPSILPSVKSFVNMISNHSRCIPVILLITIIYIDRLRARLPSHATGNTETPHRIVLASMIIATKQMNDSPPKNKHWISFSGRYFSVFEVNMMERQLLALLDYQTNIDAREICYYIEGARLEEQIMAQAYLVPVSLGLGRIVNNDFCNSTNAFNENKQFFESHAPEFCSILPSSNYQTKYLDDSIMSLYATNNSGSLTSYSPIRFKPILAGQILSESIVAIVGDKFNDTNLIFNMSCGNQTIQKDLMLKKDVGVIAQTQGTETVQPSYSVNEKTLAVSVTSLIVSITSLIMSIVCLVFVSRNQHPLILKPVIRSYDHRWSATPSARSSGFQNL